MTKNRLEAFSDGVMAIIITIMVLELKIPHASNIDALMPLIPVFLSYVLSFIYIGIYWNNHHHLLHTVKNVSAGILWSNLHLLFWLSLIPFVTGWMGENHFDNVPVLFYGIALFMCAIAYTMLQKQIVKTLGKDDAFTKAIGKDYKGIGSLVCYTLAISFSLVNQWISCFFFVVVAFIWLIPDRRVEKSIEKRS